MEACVSSFPSCASCLRCIYAHYRYLPEYNVPWLLRLETVCICVDNVFHLLACRVRICLADIGESRTITIRRTAANGRVE